MSDLMDELDEFLIDVESNKTKTKKRGVLPTQRDEITRGTWALDLGPIEGDMGKTEARVGYVFDVPDFTALCAIEGGSMEEWIAKSDECLAEDRVFGRWYSEDKPQGELDDAFLGDLIPITEEQADLIRFVDFKMPIVMMMTDWLRPKLDAILKEADETRLLGMVRRPCPKCDNDQLVVQVHYTGTAVLMAFDANKSETEKRIQLVLPTHYDRMETVDHVHWVCGNDECSYSEHVDMNEVEIFLPGHDATE